MASIWSAVLGVEQVGIDDNFFELGGDSILSIQVIAKCRAAGLHITPRDLFKTPTIAALAAGRRRACLRSPRPTTASPRARSPLTPIQHWFFEQELEDPDHWNQSFVFEVPPDIDVDRLEEALQQVVLHHDALRLRFRNGRVGLAAGVRPRARLDADRARRHLRRCRSVIAQRRSRRAPTTLQARLSMTDGPAPSRDALRLRRRRARPTRARDPPPRGGRRLLADPHGGSGIGVREPSRRRCRRAPAADHLLQALVRDSSRRTQPTEACAGSLELVARRLGRRGRVAAEGPRRWREPRGDSARACP